MRTSTQPLPAHAAFAGTVRQIMPGVMIGCMFLLTSVAFSSLNDREVLLMKLEASTVDAGVDAIKRPTIVRLMPQQAVQWGGTLPVLSREAAVKNGVRMIGSKSEAWPVERVTLEINAGYSAAGPDVRFESRKELLQILSRRRDNFELQLTLRVAPENLSDAVRMATDLSKTCAVPATQVVISADTNIEADSLFVDVFRSCRMQNVEVTTR